MPRLGSGDRVGLLREQARKSSRNQSPMGTPKPCLPSPQNRLPVVAAHGPPEARVWSAGPALSVPHGEAATNSASLWSRNGERPSSEFAMVRESTLTRGHWVGRILYRWPVPLSAGSPSRPPRKGHPRRARESTWPRPRGIPECRDRSSRRHPRRLTIDHNAWRESHPTPTTNRLTRFARSSPRSTRGGGKVRLAHPIRRPRRRAAGSRW